MWISIRKLCGAQRKSRFYLRLNAGTVYKLLLLLFFFWCALKMWPEVIWKRRKQKTFQTFFEQNFNIWRPDEIERLGKYLPNCLAIHSVKWAKCYCYLINWWCQREKWILARGNWEYWRPCNRLDEWKCLCCRLSLWNWLRGMHRRYADVEMTMRKTAAADTAREWTHRHTPECLTIVEKKQNEHCFCSFIS